MVNVLLFSPTGNSKRAALTVASVLGEKVNVVDLTKTHLVDETFDPKEPMVIAGPVFGGRLPELMVERLKRFSLKGVKVVTLVTYSNRAVEDALLELNNTVVELGGIPVASATVVARHSMVPAVAQNRPSDVDLTNLKAFARMAKQKLFQTECVAVKVPGDYPYRSWTKSPLTPIIDGNCVKCGQCVRLCPVGAIDANDPSKVDAQKCILCMRCVFVCSQQSRVLPEQIRVRIGQKLAPIAAIHRDNEFFL